jgi:hypothetical protein
MPKLVKNSYVTFVRAYPLDPIFTTASYSSYSCEEVQTTKQYIFINEGNIIMHYKGILLSSARL